MMVITNCKVVTIRSKTNLMVSVVLQVVEVGGMATTDPVEITVLM